MDDSFGGGFTQSITDPKSESKAEGTLPLFIKMIHNQEEDVIKLFGMEYKMVTVVALVRNIEHASTKITYELEDLSGRISAHLWVDEDVPRSANIMVNSYVRVVGGVRTQGEAKSIMIYNVHPVSGINEVNTHYLEVVNARFQAEEYASGTDGSASIFKGAKMEVDKSGSGDGETIEGLEGLNAKEKVVFMMVRGAMVDKSDEGYHFDVIQARFPHMSRDELVSMLMKMTNEGLIYTTVDNDHFQACF